ncbi:plasmid SOS inhibition protein A [Enterovibrio paralichthyis]|uniref:plasmid SOS inhibition protein A n=1 Tax=Enterovibrio paralichthyis TaxID=2853805 RepID=UPI001C462A1E|nr:plasmid SOS inhibition protein A [Enterovibrio paralichthyis]MBV7300219.1 plasmid SOS inhibition protein A [Enterovibrio paralichthyis]
MYPIVPFEPMVNAAQQAIIAVSAGKFARSKRPYAAAFFKALDGTSKPSPYTLIRIGYTKSSTERYYPAPKQKYIDALDILIRTEGRRVVKPLDSFLAKTLFPYAIHRLEERRTQSYQLEWNAKFKARDKQKCRDDAARQAHINNIMAETVRYSHNDFYAFISHEDGEGRFTSYELKCIVQHYFKMRSKPGSLSFTDLYGMVTDWTLGRIVLDMFEICE